MPDSPVKPSRLLMRLDAEIASARNAVEADCKRAERACYLARTGRIAEAQEVVDQLHHRYGQRPQIEVSVWMHFAEGLTEYFRDMSPTARGKILRCHALSAAVGLKSMQALSAAWLAHLDYLLEDVISAKRYIVEALDLSTIDHHAALGRASLVMAQALHYAGHMVPARVWYAHARSHATSDGDELTVSALMHNMAWLRSLDLRKGVLGGQRESDDARHALMNAESVAHFDSLIGSLGLGSLVPVLIAQTLSTSGRYAEALALYDSNLDASLVQGMYRLRADLVADRAWCRLKLGLLDESRRDVVEARESLDPNGHCDDRALAHGRLAMLSVELGDVVNAEFHSTQARAAWSEYEAAQDRLWTLLRDLRHPYLPNEKAPRRAL